MADNVWVIVGVVGMLAFVAGYGLGTWETLRLVEKRLGKWLG